MSHRSRYRHFTTVMMLVFAVVIAGCHVSVSAQEATPVVEAIMTNDTDDQTPAAQGGQCNGGNVWFRGPPIFQPLDATSAGLATTHSTGFVTIVVENMADQCNTWEVLLSGVVSVPGNYPASLSVVALDGRPLEGGICDLIAPCPVAQIGEDQIGTMALEIEIELELDPQTPVGEIGMKLFVQLNEIGS